MCVCSANIGQYNQASPTPFSSGPLAQYIGPQGDSSVASALLAGTLPPRNVLDSLLPETTSVLDTLARPPCRKNQEFKSRILNEQFIGT
jgi:hypothetical protein